MSLVRAISHLILLALLFSTASASKTRELTKSSRNIDDASRAQHIRTLRATDRETSRWSNSEHLGFLRVARKISGKTLEIQNRNSLKQDKDLLVDTVGALRKLLEYFRSQSKNVNLDAIIGVRILQGQLDVILNRLSARSDLLKDPFVSSLSVNLRLLQNLVDVFSEQATPAVSNSTPNYYNRLWPILVKGFWAKAEPARSINTAYIMHNIPERESIKEYQSDNCVSEILNTDGWSTNECDINDDCWSRMTSPGYRMYSLSHEVFYLIIGSQYGCKAKIDANIEKFHQGSLSELYSRFCSNMFEEATEIAENDFTDLQQDLFMEQIALCGIVGFKDFAKTEWLKRILSWQRPSGCYSSRDYNKIPKNSKDDDLETNSRRKRAEKVLNDGCLSHKTTVAAGALAVNVRFILEDILKKEFHTDLF
ncbi:UPF0764 protein C16orf89 homolog [Tubulanus polymorphus]|uniref:UPF0764 protein C16orf89 homolog n=1 Tax=Tubulanus polymorphus TaxID=672921 RepID=UPI003DA492BF